MVIQQVQQKTKNIYIKTSHTQVFSGLYTWMELGTSLSFRQGKKSSINSSGDRLFRLSRVQAADSLRDK